MEPVKNRLKKKQASTHEDWLMVWDSIKRAPDHGHAKRLLDAAAERTTERIKNAGVVAWGWSGGKDSLGVQAVMEHAGLDHLESFAGLTQLEYPAFDRWVRDPANQPANLYIEELEHINYEWLLKRPQLIFPTKDNARWFAPVQIASQKRFVKSRGVDLLIGGWRRYDGNYLGTGDRKYEYATPHGYTKYSPIAQWTHEDLLQVIAATGKQLPPIYAYPRGFPTGTGPWPYRRRLDTMPASWAEMHTIDPAVVTTAAANGITSAQHYLEGNTA